MKNFQLSVFLPAFNEEENIKKTLTGVDLVCRKIASVYEVLVINDGSSDKTADIVKGMMKSNKNLRLLTHSKNKGYGAAIKSGLYAVRYNWVVQMDSDGQFDFAQITRFLKKMNEADLVIGYRIKRTDSPYRRFMARMLWLADYIMFGLKVKDVDCGFKLFKKEVIKNIPKLKTESAITVTEFLVRARSKGYKISEVGVDHFSRKKGEQTGGKPSVVIKAAFQGIALFFFLLKEKIFK